SGAAPLKRTSRDRSTGPASESHRAFGRGPVEACRLRWRGSRATSRLTAPSGAAPLKRVASGGEDLAPRRLTAPSGAGPLKRVVGLVEDLRVGLSHRAFGRGPVEALDYRRC